MLNWYLRQGWPKQLVALAALIILVPILWTALASFLFIDLMGASFRVNYPHSDLGSYLVWWDYALADGQPKLTNIWLALSGGASAFPWVALVASSLRRIFGRVSPQPDLWGTTSFADRREMRAGGIKTKKRVF